MEFTAICKRETNNLASIIDLSGLDQRKGAVGDKIIEISHDAVLPKEYRAVRPGPARLAYYLTLIVNRITMTFNVPGKRTKNLSRTILPAHGKC
jgi:hypothetical protein